MNKLTNERNLCQMWLNMAIQTRFCSLCRADIQWILLTWKQRMKPVINFFIKVLHLKLTITWVAAGWVRQFFLLLLLVCVYCTRLDEKSDRQIKFLNQFHGIGYLSILRDILETLMGTWRLYTFYIFIFYNRYPIWEYLYNTYRSTLSLMLTFIGLDK